MAVEYLHFDVLWQPSRFLYPAGDMGCVDVRANLTGKIRYSTVGKWRRQRPVVDLGNVSPETLPRADWLIIVNYDRYLAEESFFPEEIATYRRLFAGGTVAAAFRPAPGEIGRPIVRAVHLPQGLVTATR